MVDVKKIQQDMAVGFGLFAKDLPGVVEKFGAFDAAVLKDGALSNKVKELIALSNAVFARCEYCIVHHVNAALAAGATRAEVAEAAAVAIAMSGGPGFAYTAAVVESALEEFGAK